MSKASRISGNTLKIKYPIFAGKWGATIPYRSTPLFSIREKETRFDVEFDIGWSNAIQSDTNLNSKHIENHTPDVDVLAVHLNDHVRDLLEDRSVVHKILFQEVLPQGCIEARYECGANESYFVLRNGGQTSIEICEKDKDLTFDTFEIAATFKDVKSVITPTTDYVRTIAESLVDDIIAMEESILATLLRKAAKRNAIDKYYLIGQTRQKRTFKDRFYRMLKQCESWAIIDINSYLNLEPNVPAFILCHAADYEKIEPYLGAKILQNAELLIVNDPQFQGEVFVLPSQELLGANPTRSGICTARLAVNLDSIMAWYDCGMCVINSELCLSCRLD